MDNILFSAIQAELPEFNERICGGLVREQLKQSLQYLTGALECASKSFPPGLQFIRVSRCTPMEEYREITRVQYGKQTVDLSKSDIYLVKFEFEHDGKPLIPVYVFLPYVNPQGSIRLRGTHIYPSPVLVDKTFSVDHKGIFLPLTRARLTFERVNHNYLANDMRESEAIAYSRIYNVKADRGTRDAVHCKSTLVHYLFCKFGVRETFLRLCDVEVHIGEDDINEKNYPASDYIICKSIGLTPTGVKTKVYTPTTLRLAIPRDAYTSMPVIKSYVAGFFYVVDHYPERIRLEDIEETRMWRVVMGKILKGHNRPEGMLANEMDTHMASLNEYVDELTRDKLRRADIDIRSTWGLFYYIIEHMSEIMIRTEIPSMYEKKLESLRYILYDITHSIFIAMFALTPDKRPLTSDSINKVLRDKIKRDAIFSLVSEKHNEASTELIPGDNMFLKLTSNMVQQTRANDNREGSSTKTDPNKILHSSQAEVGSYQNQPKFDPTGRSVVNAYVRLDSDDGVVRKEELREILDGVEQEIRRN